MHLTGVHLIGVHLIGVHLIGVHLTGVHLIGVHLIGVHLIGMHFMSAYLMSECVMGMHLKAGSILLAQFSGAKSSAKSVTDLWGAMVSRRGAMISKGSRGYEQGTQLETEEGT